MIEKFARYAALTVILAGCTTSALAAPVLRSEVSVTTGIVTVGDMFEDAGTLANVGLFRAPAPGTAGTVSLEDVTRAANAAGIEVFDAAGLGTVRVAREGRFVDAHLVSELIEGDLRARGILGAGMEMVMALDAPLPELMAADLSQPARLALLRYRPGASSFSARIEVAGISQPIEITGRVELMVEAPHLLASLSAGAIVGPDDFEMRMVPLDYAESAGLALPEDIVGKQMRRQVRAGVLIRPNDVVEPELVSRNDTVTLIYRQGPLTLTARGQALNSASLDQPVTVLNLMTKKVVHGFASPDGTVTITPTRQIAGL
ncbi:flagellar basal body P-ring formation chaperone FlgA [Pelagibacterium montanilacus]|uniref:flagellar basal body P-ring formation chaperone FlgA n=1 Tax=Pelagibacterium montanilacus TaxID=2185280 RepID=UPI000F8C36A4|nr:flagellar basal body P-ring formation chaperone FlgA [Pelagibacterium montanilacus]